MSIKEDVYNESKNKCECVNRFRNGDFTQHLTSVDIEQVVRTGGIVEDVYEGFICDNLDYNPFEEFVPDMTAKRNEHKKQGKTTLQDVRRKMSNGVYGGCIRCDFHDISKCVSENWMKTEYNDRVKEYVPLQNGNYLVNVKDHDGVDDNGVNKKVNNQPFQFGSLISSHSKRLKNDVLLALDRFKNNKTYYGDTDSVYIHKNDYDIIKDKGLVGKKLFRFKNDYGENAGIVYGLFLAPKSSIALLLMNAEYYLKKQLSKDSTKTSIKKLLKSFLISNKAKRLKTHQN